MEHDATEATVKSIPHSVDRATLMFKQSHRRFNVGLGRVHVNFRYTARINTKKSDITFPNMTVVQWIQCLNLLPLLEAESLRKFLNLFPCHGVVTDFSNAAIPKHLFRAQTKELLGDRAERQREAIGRIEDSDRFDDIVSNNLIETVKTKS